MTGLDRADVSRFLLERLRRWVRRGRHIGWAAVRLAWIRRSASAAIVVLPVARTRQGALARLAAWLRSLDRRARVIGAMIVLCLATTWLGLGFIVHMSHRQQLEDASGYADNVARLLVADLEANFTICDLSLQALLANLSNPALTSLPPVLRHQAMFNSSFNLPLFGSLLVTDKDGIIREHANAPVTRRIDVADREYFKVQRDHRDVGIFVDHPLLSRIAAEWMVVASRRIDKDGQFDGVVAGGLRLEFLKGLFLKVHLPPGSSIVLRYEDGTLMMSNGPGAVAWDPAFVKRVAERKEASVVISAEGVRSLVKERKVSGLPLYEAVSLPMAVIMRPFWRRTLTAVGVVTFTSVIISSLGVSLMRELSRRNAAEVQLQRLATIDGMTGLRNRRCFDEMLETEFRRGARDGTPLALLLIDVDYFKAYNDTYGHSAGDAALRVVADILSSEPLRASDIVARVGGEEFAVLASDTDLAGAGRLAERILHAVRERRMPHVGSHLGVVTISTGVACSREYGSPERDLSSGEPSAQGPITSAKSLFDKADAALYRAKRGGRDRVEVSPPNLWRPAAEDDRLTA